MIPVGGDVFEGEPELLALAGAEGRDVEVDRVCIWPGGLKDMQGDILGLRNLAQRVFKGDMDDRHG